MLINLKKIKENMVSLEFHVTKDNFNKAITKAFMKTKNNYMIPGMETGMIPQATIEKCYGDEVFYETAINTIIEEEFKNTFEEYKKYNLSKEKIQDINILQIGKDKDLKFELIINVK